MEPSFDPRDVSPEKFLAGLAADLRPEQSRRIISEAIGRGVLAHGEWTKLGILPRRIRDRFHDLPRLQLEHVIASPIDNFQKVLFRTPDGMPVETVLIPLHKPGAVSICVSSQVGCVMGCVFCATARMTARRNLRTWEIVDQLLHARDIARSQGRRVTGAVFMGMGEPFLNYDRVLAAAEIFCYPVRDAIAAKAITVSTVGLIREIDRFTTERRPFRLSISLGAATDAKRKALVPVAARYPVADVMAASRRHAEARRTRVMIAYVCVPDVNMGEEDAVALGSLIGDVPVRLDLIPVTDTGGTYRAPVSSEMSRFRDLLTRHVGQPVVQRYSGGADIRAACGTLAGNV